MDRSAFRRLSFFSLAILLSSAILRGESGQEPLLRVVDDRGRPIAEPLEACFQVELRSDCRRVAKGEELRPPRGFFRVRIEGENHGPLILRRADILLQPDGSLRVAVPRKAPLRVAGTPPQKLTISLYSPSDPTFREPVFRTSLAPGQAETKVPAGEFIAALTAAPHAPDLHRLVTRPAVLSKLDFRARDGWSLVVRCRAAATSTPVSGAEVEIAEAPGYGRPEKRLAVAASERDGLVLLAGLRANLVSVSVRHPEFISAEEHGLTAGPGTFAFRDLPLGIGGRLAARVTVHGRPLIGAGCRIVALAPGERDRKEPYRELWTGRVDDQGLCRSARLAAGVYKLRVEVPASNSVVNRWIAIPEAQDVDADIALAPTRISGEVRRSRKPVPGYRVQAMLIARDLPKGARGEDSTEATSDEDGKYELTLWAPGWYSVHLRTPAGVVVGGHKELTTEGDDSKDLDFDIEATPFRGRVVDEEGKPVDKARVALRWAGVIVTTTDSEGQFELDTLGEGTGSLSAGKMGYRPSDWVDLQVVEGQPLPSVTLVLKRKVTAQGVVVSAAGSPIAGALITSIQTTLEGGPLPFQSTRSDAGGQFEVEVPAGPVRVFSSGPGCPLSAFTLPAAGAAGGEEAPPSTLRCPEMPAALELTLVDDKGKPMAHTGVILRRNGTIVPQEVLATHLSLLGLPIETNGAGHLVLAGLAPGDYDLYLNTLSSESLIAAGRPQGFLATATLPPLTTTELQLTLQEP